MKDMETDEPGLLRFWFEFDLSGHAPVVEPGHVLLDGGTQTCRLLGIGIPAWRGVWFPPMNRCGPVIG
jgi:hypothetical protein